MDYRQNADRDELRAEFTVWLDKLIRRAKLDYLRKTTAPVDIVSLDDLHEENYPISEDEWMRHLLLQEDDFNFEERFTALKAEFEQQLKEEERLNKLILENLEKIK